MKLSKRLLALLLSTVLAFGLALPAMAEDDPPTEPAPAMPVITVQPQTIHVKRGEQKTLSVEAHIPNGDPLGYLWYIDDEKSAVRQSSLEFVGKKESRTAYVEVYNLNNAEYRVKSETVQMVVELTLLEKAEDFFYEMNQTIGGIAIVSVLFSPYIFFWLLSLPLHLINWIINLFR